MECTRWSASPGYESDCPHGDCPHGESMDHLNSSVGSRTRDDFTTSTPIKLDKENLKKSAGSGTEDEEGTVWSPTVQHSSGRKHLREANDVSYFFVVQKMSFSFSIALNSMCMNCFESSVCFTIGFF